MVETILAYLIVFVLLYLKGNANAKYLSASLKINVTKEILIDIDAKPEIVKSEYIKN